MAVFEWTCGKCGKLTRRLLPARPQLAKCECGGKQRFNTATSSRTVEVLDNGFQARKVERLADISDMLDERKKRNG